MYEIFVRDDGTCLCVGRLQDGTERWVKPSMREAIKSMKTFASVMNHDKKLTRRGIRVYRPREVVKTEWVEVKP
jgi:hypothetical protein